MLFNAYEFLFLFLPLTLAGYFWVARRGHEPAIVWLVLASLFFYAWCGRFIWCCCSNQWGQTRLIPTEKKAPPGVLFCHFSI